MADSILDFLWDLLGVAFVCGVVFGLGWIAWAVMEMLCFDPQDVWEGEEE